MQDRERLADLTVEDRLVPRDSFNFVSERLSLQECKPFLFLGKIVDPDHQRWEHYEPTIDEFPSNENCLSAEA